jgi:hypothetical protein
VPALAEPLTQGDILDGCPLFRLHVTADVDLDANPTR